MTSSLKKTALTWAIIALFLILAAGCSGTGAPNNPGNSSPNPSETDSATDPSATFLKDMMQLARQGKVFNCDFPAKATNIGDVENAWGKANQTEYVAAAKGSYATFPNRDIVFGFNKGGQIFEVRSFASHQFAGITLAKAREVLGTPDYETTYNGQRIIGFEAGAEFKVELIFPQSTGNETDPPMNHYNVLYPQGTVNMMADDPGRQW